MDYDGRFRVMNEATEICEKLSAAVGEPFSGVINVVRDYNDVIGGCINICLDSEDLIAETYCSWVGYLRRKYYGAELEIPSIDIIRI